MNFNLRIAVAALLVTISATDAIAHNSPGVSPSQLPPGSPPWGNPADFGNKGLADARNDKQQAADEKAQSAQQRAENAADRKGLDKSIAQAKYVTDLAKQALELYKTLTEMDKEMDPNYQPPGAPDIPSQCLESDECKVCYGDAQAKMNKTRTGLEKLRGINLYTHKMARQGEGIITSAGTAGGTIAAMGAAAENQSVDQTVAEFDAAVRSKREELLDHVKSNLQDISTCEKKFYQNDDWYNRYGFMYYQFMLAQYANLP